jgi:hypothetical protein
LITDVQSFPVDVPVVALVASAGGLDALTQNLCLDGPVAAREHR